MKKLLFAMLCIVSALGMRAQTTLTGVGSITSGEQYYIVNDATGLFLTSGNDYGTRATLDQSSCGPATVTLADGKYTIKWSLGKGLFVNRDDGSELFCDMNNQGNNYWTITSNGDNTFSLQLASDQKHYNAASYLTAASNAVFANVQYNASNENLRKWRFISASGLRSSMSSSKSKMDVSIFVHGAQCMISDNSLGNFKKMYPWQTTGNDWKGQNNANLTGFSKPWLECWNGSALPSRSAKNTISSLPAGSYTLSAYTIGGDGVTFYAKVGDGEKITAATGNGNPVLSTINFDIESGSADVEFGIESTAESTSGWIAIDNVKLEYISFSAFREVYETALQNAKDASNALNDFSVYASQKSSLDNVISSNTLTGDDLNSRSALTAASTTLENATTAVAAQVAACNQYASIVSTIGENTNVVLTSFVSNAGFELGNLNGWTSTNAGGIVDNNNFSQKVGTYFVERWQPSGNSQVKLSDGTLTHNAIVLPAGIYQISATGQVQEQKNGVTGGGYFLYANSEKVEIGAPARYNTYVKLNDDKSELVIKFALESCTGNWISCDDVQLTYVGSDFPAVTLVEGKMSTAAATAQTIAKEAFDADKTGTNYKTLVAAIAAAQTSKDAYAKTATAIADAKTLGANFNFATAAATTTFNEAVTAVETAYNDGTLEDASAKNCANLGTVLVGWHPARSSENYTIAEAYMKSAWTGGELNDWSTEGDTDGSNFHVPFFQNWIDDANSLTEGTTFGQLTGLDNGLYRVSAQVRVRIKNGQEAGTAPSGITLKVNNGSEVNVCAGGQIGESQFYLGTFEAEGLVKDGTLNAIFTRADGNNVSWLSFKNVQYTKVRDLTPAEEAPATVEDYAALNTAIANAEAKTLGFDEGDYAPYNNITVLAALAAAKAINQEGDNAHDDVVAATNAIADSEWNANAEEVNAVYDGTFAAATNNGAPKGWRMTNNTLGGDYHSRAFVGDDRMSEFNGTNSGFFLRFDGTNSSRGSMYYYGDTKNYTMPLKEGVKYFVKVDVAGWGSTGKPIRMNVNGPTGFSSVNQQLTTSVRADNADNTPQQFFIVFTANVAGNYVINFQTPGADTNTHNVVISNVELFRASEATMKTFKAGTYGTFIAPFDVTIPSGVTASKVTGHTGNTLELTDLPGTIPANTPVVVKGIDAIEQTFYGKNTADQDSYKEGPLVGVYTDDDVPVGSYVLQTQGGVQGFYKVSTALKAVPNRAYLTLDSPVKAYFFDQTDAVRSLQAEEAAEGTIYNLSGQRVQKAQKGIYIVNGKKTVIK